MEHAPFEVGVVYNRRNDIHKVYGGQQQGGISTPARAPMVFLFTGSSGEQHGYRDDWDDNGVFLYTGEGQVGDMEFVRGNLAIRDQIANGREIHLFASLGKSMGCRYLGQFSCVDFEYRRGPDTNGNDRRVIVFHLVPETNEQEQVTPKSAEQAGQSLESLRERALEAVSPAQEASTKESRKRYYQRCVEVKRYVLARGAGICESCRKPAPFLKKNGEPYLEPHHTRRLADGGLDHPRWVGAICPNCHREIHHGENGDAVNGKLQKFIKALEDSFN
jgi:5-methylcytosine-specific restriction protein A